MFHRVKTTPENRPEQESEVRAAGADTENSRERFQERPQEKPLQKTEQKPQQQAQESLLSRQAASGSRPTPNQEKDRRPMTPREDIRSDNDQAEQQGSARSLNIPGSYNPGRSPVTGGYPGAYPGSSYAAKPLDGVRGAAATLTIGQGITLSGEIEACDHLVVEGNVEAALKGAKLLEVAESGTFFGTVEIERATIAGRFEGDLTVNGRLTLRSTGIITGSIAYRELEIEAGAVIEGRVTPLKAPAQEAAPRPTVQSKSKEAAAAIAKAREFRAQKEAQDAANADDEDLFAEKSAAGE